MVEQTTETAAALTDSDNHVLRSTLTLLRATLLVPKVSPAASALVEIAEQLAFSNDIDIVLTLLNSTQAKQCVLSLPLTWKDVLLKNKTASAHADAARLPTPMAVPLRDTASHRPPLHVTLLF